MPDYTAADIDKLVQAGAITNKDAGFLKQDLIEQASKEQGLLRKLLSNISHDFVEAWKGGSAMKAQSEKDIKQMKEGKLETPKIGPHIDVMTNALTSFYNIWSAFGQAAAEPTYKFLVNRGVSKEVANYAASYIDIATQFGTAGAASGVAKSAFQKYFTKQFSVEAATKTAAKPAEQAVQHAENKAAALDETSKLLDDAAKVVRGEGGEQAAKATSTSQTLEAAYQTSLGKQSTEAMVNDIGRRAEIRAANRGLNAQVVRGGAPMAAEETGATLRARQAFEEGAAKYESSKINMAALEAEAKSSGKSMADVLMLKQGQPATPLEVAQISQPIKQSGEDFIKYVDDAEEALAKGDYAPFHRALAEFNFQVKAHWPYMAPRQVAGQTLKTYDQPVLSATNYLQQIPGVSSWMAKLRLNTVDEVEANAAKIIKEMQKIKAPHELANYAKTVAEQTAQAGDDVLRDPTWRDKASYWFINSLMSGTDTIGRNVAGNMIFAPWHYATKQTSNIAAKILNPFTNAEHHLENGYLSEANTFVTTWAKSLWDASRYALTRQYDKLYNLVPDESARAALLASRYDLVKYSNTGTTNPIGGMIGKAVGTPVTIAQAADEVSRIAFYRAAVGERAMHDWISTNSKIPFQQYIEDYFRAVPPSSHEYGIRMALEGTFSDKMSAVGRAASRARTDIPGTEFIVPFVKTTDRISASIWNHTPILNMASTRLRDEIMSGDPVRMGEGIGRVLWTNIVGAGLFMGMGNKAPDGMNYVTGGGPTDRELAKFQRDQKLHLPYTAWTPLGRLPYHNLMPVGGPVGMIADAREIWDGLREPDATVYWSGIVLALQRNFFDTTYAKSFSDFFSIWDDPGSLSPTWRYAANLAKGFLEPAIVRQVMRAIDPTVKEVGSVYDELTKDIPGWGVPPKRDLLTGDPVTIPPRMFENVPIAGWVLPTSPMQPKSDAFANKIKELGIKLPEFYKSFGGSLPSNNPFAYQTPLGEAKEAAAGIPIPEPLRQQGVDYMHSAEMFGKTLSDEGNDLVQNPEFNKMAPIDQAENIISLYHARMSAARERLIGENPELAQAYEVQLQKRAEVRMPPEQREAFTKTLEPEEPQERPVQFVPMEEAAGGQ